VEISDKKEEVPIAINMVEATANADNKGTEVTCSDEKLPSK